MSATINLVSIGVTDVARSTAFYEALGFVKSEQASVESTTFMKAGGVVISLFGRQALTGDLEAAEVWSGNGGIALAYNQRSQADVDAFMQTAKTAGARILKPASKTFWGGYAGSFADADGNVWEIAHNPFFPMTDDGLLTLPD